MIKQVRRRTLEEYDNLPTPCAQKAKEAMIPALMSGASNPERTTYSQIPRKAKIIAFFLERKTVKTLIKNIAVKETFVPEATTT